MRVPRRVTKIFTALFMLLCGITAIYAAELDYGEESRLISEGRLDEAEIALNKKLSSNNKDAAALSLLGELYRQKGDRRKALKFLNEAVSIDPKYPMPYLYRGKLYFSMQAFDEIAAEFSLFMKNMRPLINSSDDKQFYIENLHDISYTYLSLKKYDETRVVLDEILSLAPEDTNALYNLGLYYYMSERDRSKAYQCFTKVVRLEQDTALARKARYAVEFMRTNPDPRVDPDMSFIDREYKD